MSASLPLALRAQIREIEAGLCAYCHSAEALSVASFEIDHILPVSAGGDNEFDNLCLACPACNRHKAARRDAPDPATGRVAPLFHPRQNIWDEHFAWSSDATVIIGKTATGRATVEALRMNRPQLQRLRHLWQRLDVRVE